MVAAPRERRASPFFKQRCAPLSFLKKRLATERRLLLPLTGISPHGNLKNGISPGRQKPGYTLSYNPKGFYAL
jgi:hypothetical protein